MPAATSASTAMPTYDGFVQIVGRRKAYQGLFLCLMSLSVGAAAMQILMLGRVGSFAGVIGSRVTTAVPLPTHNPAMGSPPTEGNSSFVEKDDDDDDGEDCAWTSVLRAAFCIGLLSGAAAYAPMADHWGRRHAHLLAAAQLASAAPLTMLARGPVARAGVRAFAGFATAGLLSVSRIWHLETPHRGDCGPSSLLLMMNGWTGGTFMLAGIAHWSPDWRVAEAAAAGITVLLLPLTRLCLTESPRWLLSRGRADAAIAALRRMAQVSRTGAELDDLLERLGYEARSGQQQATTMRLPLRRLLTRSSTAGRNSALLWLLIAASGAAHLGLVTSWSSAAVGGVGFSNSSAIYAGLTVAGCAELAGRLSAALLFGLLAAPRSAATAGGIVVAGLLGAGAACLAAASAFPSAWRLWPLLLGRACLAPGAELAWLLANQLLPAPIRDQAIGVGFGFACLGTLGIACLDFGFYANFPGYHGLWQLMVCSGLSAVACPLALLLPAARHPFPDTLDDNADLLGALRLPAWCKACCNRFKCCDPSHCNGGASDTDALRVPEIRVTLDYTACTAVALAGGSSVHRLDNNSLDSSAAQLHDHCSDVSDLSSLSHLATKGSVGTPDLALCSDEKEIDIIENDFDDSERPVSRGDRDEFDFDRKQFLLAKLF